VEAALGGRLWLTSATRRRRVPSCRGGVQASCSELKARAKPKLQGELEQVLGPASRRAAGAEQEQLHKVSAHSLEPHDT